MEKQISYSVGPLAPEYCLRSLTEGPAARSAPGGRFSGGCVYASGTVALLSSVDESFHALIHRTQNHLCRKASPIILDSWSGGSGTHSTTMIIEAKYVDCRSAKFIASYPHSDEYLFIYISAVLFMNKQSGCFRTLK